jgi:lysyl-tRNA synthetase class 1
MFWGDRVVNELEKRYTDVISAGTHVVVRDEKTASGRVHVGSLRSASLHGVVSEILEERNIAHIFFFEINDLDPMDAVPGYLDKAVYEEHLGKPLFKVPSPEKGAANFADYYGNEYLGAIEKIGFHPEVYRASELYGSGRMNEVIRTALERANDIRRIYKEASGSEKTDNWLPLSVICEKCGKISTTQVISFDGERVTYTCAEDAVTWTHGCGHSGSVSPFDGNAKLPWKVEWAAKFKVLGVHFEGAGKDHFTKGGARQVADQIAREVFNYEPPYGVANEFFLVGGKKMSSSHGSGSSAREIADLLPTQILRLALFGTDISRQTNFDPEGDTIPILYDRYDMLAGKYFTGAEDDDTRLFQMIHKSEARGTIPERFLSRFSQVAFLVQMPHMSLEKEVSKLKGDVLTTEDKKELEERKHCALDWLKAYAPEAFKFELQEVLPEGAKNLSDTQKEGLRKVLAHIESQNKLDGQELHAKLHDIRKEVGIEPKEFFGALYVIFLGKDHGPKAGWFLSVLDRKFLVQRLKEAVS